MRHITFECLVYYKLALREFRQNLLGTFLFFFIEFYFSAFRSLVTRSVCPPWEIRRFLPRLQSLKWHIDKSEKQLNRTHQYKYILFVLFDSRVYLYLQLSRFPILDWASGLATCNLQNQVSDRWKKTKTLIVQLLGHYLMQFCIPFSRRREADTNIGSVHRIWPLCNETICCLQSKRHNSLNNDVISQNR